MISIFFVFLEFLAANLEKSLWMNNDERLKSAFRIFDVKNTGKVMVNELKAIFGSWK